MLNYGKCHTWTRLWDNGPPHTRVWRKVVAAARSAHRHVHGAHQAPAQQPQEQAHPHRNAGTRIGREATAMSSGNGTGMRLTN